MVNALRFAFFLGLFAAVGCGGGDSEDGAGGNAGSGGTAGTGGTAGSGGTAGAGGFGGNGGVGGKGGTFATGIECDAFATLDEFDMPGNAAQFPTLAVSGDYAAAIWAERTSSYEGVAVARYDFSAETWSAPFDVFSQENAVFTPPYDVAVDADGDVAAIWREVQGGIDELYVRLYDASSESWGDPEEVTSDDYGSIQGFQIEYDRSTGEPMVAFISPKDGRRNAYFTKRGPAGWSGDALLENHDADHISTDMDFVSNDVGQALFVYFIDVGGTTPTWYMLPYHDGDFRRDGSNVLDPLSFNTDAFIGSPQADLADTGQGIVLIDDSFSTQRELLAPRIDVGTGSSTAPRIVAEAESPQSFWLRDSAISESGSAVAAWGQTEQIGGDQHPWVSVYDGSWSTPQEVGTFFIGTEGVKTAIDGTGTITVAWSSGFNGILATRNTAQGGAFLPQQEITGMVAGSGEVEVAAHDSGDFLLVWQENVDVRAVRCR